MLFVDPPTFDKLLEKMLENYASTVRILCNLHKCPTSKTIWDNVQAELQIIQLIFSFNFVFQIDQPNRTLFVTNSILFESYLWIGVKMKKKICQSVRSFEIHGVNVRVGWGHPTVVPSA
jgi:hypothetical protein